MKIIEALKKIKHLDRKIEKARKNIAKWGSYLVDPKDETFKPTYDTEDIRKMIQQIGDWVEEKIRIRHAMHRTNMETKVEFRGQRVTIDELLLARTVSIPANIETLRLLRRAEKGGSWTRKESDGERAVLQYDPRERDKTIDALENMSEEIDGILDRLNIETDVME